MKMIYLKSFCLVAGNTSAVIDYALSELGVSVGNLDDTVNARHTNTVLSDIDLQNGDG